MGKFVTEEIARDAYDNGICIGQTEPCRETKYTWWKVFRMADNRIIAVVMSGDSDVVCGEEITDNELGRYTD